MSDSVSVRETAARIIADGIAQAGGRLRLDDIAGIVDALAEAGVLIPDGMTADDAYWVPRQIARGLLFALGEPTDPQETAAQ